MYNQIRLFPLYYLLVTIMALPLTVMADSFFLGAQENEENQPVTTLSLCVDPDWEPFERITKDGEFRGIAADLIALIGKRSNIRFELIPTQSWEQSLEYSQEGKCQAVAFLNKTPEREQWLIFTQTYFKDYNVFITREEHDYISDPAGLTNKSIALPKGTSIEEIIRERYPNLKIILTDTEKQSLQLVNNRKADMTLRSLTMAAWVIRNEGWFNLKIAGQLPDFTNELRMGLLPELQAQKELLDEAIATLSPQEIQRVVNQHISIEVLRPVDYTLIRQIGIALLLVIFVGFFWILQLRRLNKKLDQKQKQLSGIISNLPGFIYRCAYDQEFTMYYITDVCTRITGYTPSDFLENMVSFGEIILKEDAEIVATKWKEALADKTHFQHEYRIIHADNSVRWIWERGHGIFDNNGNLLFLEGFINDITQKKNAENSLRESEKKYRLLAENSQDVIWVLNLDQNKFTYMSPAIYHLRGLTIDEALNEPLEKTLTAESLKKVMKITEESYRKIKESNDKDLFINNIIQVQQPHKNGSLVWVEVATRMSVNNQGEIEVLGVSRNINDRKKQEKLIQENAARQQAFIEATNTGAWEYNKKTDTLWCSPQYFGMLGRNINDYDLSNPQSRQVIWESLVHPEDFPQTDAYLRDFLENPEGDYEQVFRMLHQNGSSVWILSRGKNLPDSNGKPGAIIVGTHIDITKQKITEEMVAAKNKELESFLYVASHDLRSPLVNVQGFSSRIEKNMNKLTKLLNEHTPGVFDNTEIAKVIKEIIPTSLSLIYSNVDKMNDLINGLLTISRTGRIKMDIKECNMKELIARIIKSHSFQLESVDAKITVDPDLSNCYGDEKLLNQLFSNIIDNAIKYRKLNAPLEIQIGSNNSQNQITYSITDNGIGINERSLNKIWDVFYRVNTHSDQKGEGIGLNIAAKIIEKHNGMIWVESQSGKGSSFFIQLPSKSFQEAF